MASISAGDLVLRDELEEVLSASGLDLSSPAMLAELAAITQPDGSVALLGLHRSSTVIKVAELHNCA